MAKKPKASAGPKVLGSLRQISARIGANPDLVQGGGGNSSLKDNGTLWIKASGTWLARAETEEVFIAVDLERLNRQIAAGLDEPSENCFAAASGLRPSIETTLHALMPQRIVLHTHAVNTIARAVRVDRQAHLARLLSGMEWALVPYQRPGLPLTRAVANAVRQVPGANVLVLANHGLVVGADSEHEAEALTLEVERRLAIAPREAPKSKPDALLARHAGEGWRLPADELVHAVATDGTALARAREGALYPDHVVFLGAGLPLLEGTTDVGDASRQHRSTYGTAPAYLVIPGRGVLVRDGISPGAEEMLRCLARVLLRIPSDAVVNCLREQDIADLLNWDAEQFRQSLDGIGPSES